MRKTALAAAATAWLLTIGAGTSWATSGDLDTSFSGDGRVATVVSGDASDAWDVAVQDDGKIVVVGSAGVDFQHADWGLVRYKRGGALDKSFSGDGKVTTSWTAGDDEAYAVKILPNGKILVAGQAGLDIGIARYTPAGQLDDTFGGGDGKVVTNLTPSQDFPWDIELLDHGQFLVAGDAGDNAVVLRYNKNGGRDMTFGTNGMAKAHFSSSANAREMALQPNGKILVTGFLFSSPFSTFLARFTSDGHLDHTFGQNHDGKVVTLEARDSEGWGLYVLSGGTIVLLGYANSVIGDDTTRDAVLEWFTKTGETDTEFGGGDGRAFLDLGDENDFVLATARQADGKFLLAGSSGDQAVVARVKPGGTLDHSFSGNGVAKAGFAGGAQFWGVGLTPTNRIVASGYVSAQGQPEKYATARFLP
ncbi:MAG TPA: delta-60 repeat domain-containing protein [Actinomycetota bacterium]